MRKLLFFHASWCSPCRFYEREFIQPLEECVGAGPIQHVDAQRHPFLADRYLIDKLPTVVLLEHTGEVKAKRTGAIDVDWVAAWLKGGEGFD